MAKKCPYCGAIRRACDHRLAVIDRSFLTCDDGYAYNRIDEFDDLVVSTFRPLLETNKKPRFKWLEYEENELQELWDYAVSSWAPDQDYIEIDGYILMRMRMQLFNSAGAEEIQSETDGGYPGSASAMSTFFAADSEQVFDAALLTLKEHLDAGVARSK